MNWRKPMRDRCAQSGIIGVLVACSASVAQQADWYVDADGAGSDPWDAAYTDLQTVLTSPYLDPGEVIWVAAGTYKPATTADRDASFELVSEVKMYGGFHGGQDGETELAERDIFTNETILSGDIDTNGDDDCYHVVWSDLDAQTSRLDGFTIRDGVAGDQIGVEADWYGGGGASGPAARREEAGSSGLL